jgi:hypothetical protein
MAKQTPQYLVANPQFNPAKKDSTTAPKPIAAVGNGK